MLNITKKFRTALFNDQRDYIENVAIELSDGTKLNLRNENLLEGVGFEDMVSEDGNFQIGAAIVGSASVKINNMYDDFTDYNFDKAKVQINIGLSYRDGTSEIIRKFTGYVEEAKYNGSVIDLTCLDYMGLFDQVYDGALGFPNTAGGIIRYCCSQCNVYLGSATFPRDDVEFKTAPDFGGNCTYRQLVSWVAQESCCFARCDVHGRLELKWYNMDALNAEANRLDGGQFDKGTPKYQTGDHADGGGFMTGGEAYDGGDFTTTTEVHNINGIFSCEVSKDPVKITGISVTSAEYDVDTTDSDGNVTTERKTYTAMVGTDDYVLAISGNPLIASPEAATATANYIASKLVGFTFWPATVSHLNNPAIEAGDVMVFSDYKGVTYRGVVSSTSFKVGELQQTHSSAETPTQNRKTQRTSADVVSETIRKLENWLHQQKTAYEIGIENLSNALNAKEGLYVAKEDTGDGEVWYLHDKPDLKKSNKVIMITSDGIGFSTDGGKTFNSGMTIDGDLVAKILSAHGVSADWITTGVLADKKGKNGWNLDTGEFVLGDPASANSNLLLKGDIAGVVTNCIVEYALTSTDTAPGTNSVSWAQNVAWEKGKYLWSRTKTTTQDGKSSTTTPELIIDKYGNSASVTAVQSEWIQTTTNSAPASNNSSWSSTQPTYVYGRYIWTRTKITYEDGTVSTTDAVLANSLNKSPEDTWKELTDNGNIVGMTRFYNSSTGKYELHFNATCIGSGILRSNDSSENFRLDLATGQMTMKKGSINLGEYTENGTKKYNFTVNDSGQVAIKKGSIDLGDDSTYGFHVSTAGRLSWKATNSSLDQTGNLNAKNATLTSANVTGTIRTVDGEYETIMDDGWIYFKKGGNYIGKIGAAVVDQTGDCFNINSMGSSNGFGLYNGGTGNAEPLLTWVKSDRRWDHEGSVFNWNSNGTNYMSLHNASLYVPKGNVYAQGYRCLTTNDGVTGTVGFNGLDGNVYDAYFTNGLFQYIKKR